MGPLGMPELLIIALIIIILFGARRIPELAKGLAKASEISRPECAVMILARLTTANIAMSRNAGKNLALQSELITGPSPHADIWSANLNKAKVR